MSHSTRHPRHGANRHQSSQPAEADEISKLRKTYGSKLQTLSAIFDDWTEEDLLFTLQDAHGDLELASNRIAEGLAERWGSVKTKKTKPQPATNAPSHAPSHAPSRGQTPVASQSSNKPPFSERGSRPVRGARGGARGGLHPHTKTASHTNGHPGPATNALTPPTFAPAQQNTGATPPTKKPMSWAAKAKAANQPASAQPIPSQESFVPLPSSDVTIPSTEPVHEDISVTAEVSNVETAPSVEEQAAAAPQTKKSWAQIARPPAPVAKPTPPTQNDPEPEPEPTITIPTIESIDPVVESSIPAAEEIPIEEPKTVPVELSTPQPLPIGEGWADAVLSTTTTTSIAPEASETHETDTQEPVVSLPTSVAASSIEQEDSLAAPPGLSMPAVTAPAIEAPAPTSTPAAPKRPVSNVRGQQQAAVIMPGNASLDERVTVQFGSLSLLDGSGPVFGSARHPGKTNHIKEAQEQGVQTVIEAPVAKPVQPPVSSLVPNIPVAPAVGAIGPTQVNTQTQASIPTQTHDVSDSVNQYFQPPTNYGYMNLDQSHLYTHNNAAQPPQTQTGVQTQTQTQQTPAQTQPNSFATGPAANTPSGAYGSNLGIGYSNGSTVGNFNQNEYNALYGGGQEIRNFYDQYGHHNMYQPHLPQQPAQSSPLVHGRQTEEHSTTSTSTTTSQTHVHQQPHPSLPGNPGQGHGYGMMPYYSPYGYYNQYQGAGYPGAYNNQYGSQPQPPYGGYPPFPARGMPNPYPQPSHSQPGAQPGIPVTYNSTSGLNTGSRHSHQGQTPTQTPGTINSGAGAYQPSLAHHHGYYNQHLQQQEGRKEYGGKELDRNFGF